ncbi:MAG: hypothetical protein EVA65_05605 [Oceanococcus sp.]|nr:MAG: hypothetical protein EVA65_05605 [Oceanococcus sp.]
MLDFLTNPSFMPHGYCLRWQPGLLWTHVLSDIGIAIAYFSIPAMIVYFLRRRMAISDVPGIYLAVGAMFACFIVFCGITHLMGMATIWLPWYGLQGLSKALTAAISVVTALAMIPILPKALNLRTAEELEAINMVLESEIEQRREREAELNARNAELQQQISARERAEQGEQQAQNERAQLAQTLHELKAAQTRLVEAEKLASLGKSMAGIAHEVNTPVGISITAATSLQEDLAQINLATANRTLTEEGLSGFLERANQGTSLVHSNLERAARLLQSVKQVATDQSNDDTRSIQLKEYLELVLASIKPKLIASRRDVVLDCPDGLTVLTKPGAIAQVVTNLVLNALTHAYEPDEPGNVEIKVEAVAEQFTLSCTDHGKGIPSELHQRIFEPFYTTKGAEGGSGIGLDIVSAIVEDKLQGKVQVSSAPGQGATFTVTTPTTLVG